MKNVLRDMQPRPICVSIFTTFVADPPDRRIDKQRRKLPARMRSPGIYGWLCQVVSFLQLESWHVVFIATLDTVSYVSTAGLSALHV